MRAAYSYTRGSVTVGVTGDLAGFVTALADSATQGLVAALRAVAEEVVAKAEDDWYGPTGVTRRTGKSGQFVIRTAISPTQVKMSLYPEEQYAFFVHRRGALSLRPKFFLPGTGRKEWAEATKRGLPTGREKGGQRRWIVYEPHPKASDGAYLWQEFMAKPFKLAMKRLPEKFRKQLTIVRKAKGRALASVVSSRKPSP